MAISKQGTDVEFNNSNLFISTWSAGNHTLVAGTNRVVVVTVGLEGNSQSIDGVTYGGVTMDEGPNINTTGQPNDSAFAKYYLLEADLPSDGSNAVSISCGSTSNARGAAGVSQYQGVAQEVPVFGTGQETSPGDSTIEDTVNVTTDNSWILAGASCGNEGTWTHDNGQNEVIDENSGPGDGMSLCMAEWQDASSGSKTPGHTFSTTANRFTHGYLILKPVGEKEEVTGRWRADDGAEGNGSLDGDAFDNSCDSLVGAQWLAAQGINILRQIGQNTRLRNLIQLSGTYEGQFSLYFKHTEDPDVCYEEIE